jgi:hypothetical protein
MDYLQSHLKDFIEESKRTVYLDEGLKHNLRDTIKQINFYKNSKFLEGEYDELKRFKPFLNIVNAGQLTARSALDIDTKELDIYSDDMSEITKALLFKKGALKWFEKHYFAKTINKIIDIGSTYGGVLVKQIKKDGYTEFDFPLWSNMYVNPKNIDKGFKIEKHELQVKDLYAKVGIWNKFKAVAQIAKNEYKDSDNVIIYEMYASVPKEGKLGSKCVDQKVILCDYNGNVTVLHQEEKESPYFYHNHDEVQGRGLGKGEIEIGFQAQAWTNDAILKYRRAMELGSKTLFQTADPTALNNIMLADDGHIFRNAGSPISQINTLSNATPQFEKLINIWAQQYQGATATYDALRGETPPSGQPYSLQQLVVNQSSNTFEVKREGYGAFLEKLMRDVVLKDIKKDLNKARKESHSFTLSELQLLDDVYVKNIANEKAKKLVLEGKIVTPEIYTMELEKVRDAVTKQKNTRFFDIKDGDFLDFEPAIKISWTNEKRNKSATIASLSTIIQTVASNPAILQDPLLRNTFMEIIQLAGFPINPLDIQQYASTTIPSESAPVQGASQSTPTALTAENLGGGTQ